MSHLSEELPEFSPDRSYIIYIVCSTKSRFNTTIKYASDGLHDIYVFSKVPALVSYLKTLLLRLADLPSTRLILVNQDTEVLIDILDLLSTISAPHLIMKQKETYVLKFRENLLRLSGTSPDTDATFYTDFHATIPVGHADLPQAFQMALVLNGDNIDELNYLTEEHVFTQQSLRFVALKHGVGFGVVSGFEALIQSTSAMVSLATRLFPDGPGSENFIYNPEGVPLSPKISVHQYIPQGWDSWTKIVLVARSVPKYNKYEKLFSSEVQIDELNDAYDSYFSESRDKDSEIRKRDTTRQKPENEEFEHKIDSKKRRKYSLMKFLCFKMPLVPKLTPQDTQSNYEDFLKNLKERKSSGHDENGISTT